MTIKTIAAALTGLLLGSALLASPASADDVPWEPAIAYPILTSSPEVVVQVNAGPKTWYIKQQAWRLDALIDGLTIRTSGDCATADVCVNVHVDHYDWPEMSALTWGQAPHWRGVTIINSATERTIYLNTFEWTTREYRRATSGHELGHALGLGHHTSPGLMAGDSSAFDYTIAELAVLRDWYGDPANRQPVPQ